MVLNGKFVNVVNNSETTKLSRSLALTWSNTPGEMRPRSRFLKKRWPPEHCGFGPWPGNAGDYHSPGIGLIHRPQLVSTRPVAALGIQDYNNSYLHGGTL